MWSVESSYGGVAPCGSYGGVAPCGGGVSDLVSVFISTSQF